MLKLPLTGRPFSYRGSNPEKSRRISQKNRTVAEVARYANTLIANNPEATQQLFFVPIAIHLGCDVDVVRHAIGGGSNGVTFLVTPDDRVALERFKTNIK